MDNLKKTDDLTLEGVPYHQQVQNITDMDQSAKSTPIKCKEHFPTDSIISSFILLSSIRCCKRTLLHSTQSRKSFPLSRLLLNNETHSQRPPHTIVSPTPTPPSQMMMMMLLMLQESESENRHRAIRLNSVNFKMARKEQRHFQVLEEAFSQVFSILVAINQTPP